MINRSGRFRFTQYMLPLLTGIGLSACSNSMSEINDLTGKRQTEGDKGTDVTVLYSKNGKVQARLFTHELIRNDAATPPFTDMKKGLKVEFFNDSAVVKSTVTAIEARWYELEGNIILRDSVVVINEKGERLDTQELIWNQSIRKFYSEKPVTITTSTLVIQGTGMVANEDFSPWDVKNPRGTIRVSKQEVPGN